MGLQYDVASIQLHPIQIMQIPSHPKERASQKLGQDCTATLSPSLPPTHPPTLPPTCPDRLIQSTSQHGNSEHLRWVVTELGPSNGIFCSLGLVK